MRDFVRARGLSDIRTATTIRIHAKPRQKGTTHLDLFLLGKEKQKLNRELALLKERARCIQQHLAEIEIAITRLEFETKQEKLESSRTDGGPASMGSDEDLTITHDPFREKNWKKVTLSY